MTGTEAPAEVWVDANVVLRLLTGKPKDHARSAALMARADAGEIRLRLCPLVVAEVVWVLASSYHFPSQQIATVLSSFLASGGLIVEEGLQLTSALALMAEKQVDFVDAYLAVKARLSPSPVAAFDSDFERLDVERVALGTGQKK